MYRAVQRVAQAHKPFTTSFATFCELRNDEKTRTFLAMEIGAGHQELRALVEALTPALRAIRQQEYYDKPRFHASIGWALLDRPAADESQQCDFPTIPGIPDTLIADLNEIYGSRLTSTKVSVLEVQGITIKIGKEIRSWTFSGS
ncbi:hypothetical protein AX16_003519 [Volvariella volvacea WC 439]|nr:hypothetical protein AX16_003519 [Volvariella volvacea WC 439]